MDVVSAVFGAMRLAAFLYSGTKQMIRKRQRGGNCGGLDIDADVNVELGGGDDEDGEIVGVGMELAMKTGKLFRSRKRTNPPITGLSTAFATHRQETRQVLASVDLRLQTATQTIAEELVGVRSDLRYGTAQLARGLAVVRNDVGEITDKVDGIWTAVTCGVQEVRYAMEGLRGDINDIESSLLTSREENLEYFQDISSRLDGIERSMRKQQELQLPLAFKHLNDFMASEGTDRRPLTEAYNCSLKILNLPVEVDSLDVHFGAGIVAVSTAYTRLAMEFSPAEAKKRVIGGTFKSITQTFDAFLVNPFSADDPDCRKVVIFLLDIVSSICMLPPEGVLLPQLDSRLVEAFGIICASSPTPLLDRYPEVGGAALRALLQSMPLDKLCRTSKFLHVDISLCDNKADIIQSLLDEGKPMDRATLGLALRTRNHRHKRNDGETALPNRCHRHNRNDSETALPDPFHRGLRNNSDTSLPNRIHKDLRNDGETKQSDEQRLAANLDAVFLGQGALAAGGDESQNETSGEHGNSRQRYNNRTATFGNTVRRQGSEQSDGQRLAADIASACQQFAPLS